MSKNPELDALIKKSAEETEVRLPWEEPEIFQYNSTKDQVRMVELYNSGRVRNTFRPLRRIAESEFELFHPELMHKSKEREEYIASVLEQGNEYGEWVFNQGELIQYPDRDTYRKLRTYRYRNLINAIEQERLNQARPAVFGLSVGGNIAVALVRNGIGEAVALGDFDTVDVAGIGRNVADVRDVGVSKIDTVAKQISILDPFIEQRHFRGGFYEDMEGELAEYRPDAIFDEIDDVVGSVAIRAFCRRLNTQYLTAADMGDRAILESVRHNLGHRKLYAGMVSDKDIKKLVSGEASDGEQAIIFAKSLGISNLAATPRLIESYAKLGEEVSGVPQLGSTALMATGLAVMAYRDTLLDKKSKEGIVTLKPDVLMRTKPSLPKIIKGLRLIKLKD